MKLLSEKELIQKINSGNDEYFKMLFLKYYRRLYSFTLGLVKNSALAEDIAQNVFLKLWLRRETISGNSINNLLYTIAKNEIADHFKSAYNIRQQSYGEVPDTLTVGEDIAGMIDASLFLKKAESIIEKESSRRKEIFNLSRINGLSNKEIAERLGISVRTVEKSIQITLKNIRNNLQS